MSDDEVSDAIKKALQPVTPDEPPEHVDTHEERLQACVHFDLNDTGNGKRLIKHFGDRFLHVREHGDYVWVGSHWGHAGGEEMIKRFAQQTSFLIREEIAFIEDCLTDHQRTDQAIVAKERARRRAFSVSSGNTNRLNGMISQASPHLTFAPGDMDVDPMVFNIENGTLQFREIKKDGDTPRSIEIKLLPHDKDMRLTKCAPVFFDPDAQCPHWHDFLTRFQPDGAIRKFLQIFMGYCLTGLTSEQKLLFLYGEGANGKSTFVEALSGLMGEYSVSLNPESVTGNGQRRGDQATPDLADLEGKRFVRVSEIPRGEMVKESLIKSLTGGEPIRVRRLHQDFFDLTPIFKAVMSGNDMPYITGTDFGIWRRLLIVPWEIQISEAERRPMADVLAEFEAERAGILNWLLDGLRMYFDEGLEVPERVSNLTGGYKADMDPLQQFVDSCLEFVPPEDGKVQSKVTGKDMYDAYKRWCEASGIKVFSNTYVGRELPKKGIEKRNERIRVYINVRLRLPDEVHDVVNSEKGGYGNG